MKKTLALALAAVMALSLIGCGGGGSQGTQAPNQGSQAQTGSEAATGGQTEAPTDAPEVVSEFHGPIYDDWSEKTDDELYAMAKEEGGQITVYATSSKMLKNEEAFEEAFPDLDVVIVDMDSDEVSEKCATEARTGNINGDVLQVKDPNGSIFHDLVEEGLVTSFYPKDICEHIDPELLKYGYPLYSSQSFWYYNTKAFPDGQPIHSWWDILDTNEDGTQKYRILCKEIGTETAYLALFASFIQNADQMAAAYKEKTGEDLEYTYDASKFDFEVPENNAGVEYIWRFSQLRMTFIKDGDELVQAVHNSTADDPALALASAGKIGNREESGYDIAWVVGLTPYTAVQNVENLYVVAGCDNEAGARLFIRWCTGGADGESKGLKPFKKEGNWPARDDIECDWNGDYASVKDCGAIAPDVEGIYEMFLDAQDMWTYWLNQNPNMK